MLEVTKGKSGARLWLEIRRKRGVPVRIAEACGISPQAVLKWQMVPPTRVLIVERVTGVPRWRLRPDIYPEEAARPLAAA